MSAHCRSAEILLIEDNPGDRELIQEALHSGKMTHRVSVVTDGELAMAFLNRDRGFEDTSRPDLILLDLNLPKKDGFEVLKELREHPKLHHIPVVVLTSSEADRDIVKSYNLQANCFISKPVDVDEFMQVVRATGEFWLSLVTLPLNAPD